MDTLPPQSYRPPSLAPVAELRSIAERTIRRFVSGEGVDGVDAARMAVLVLDPPPVLPAAPQTGVCIVARYRGGYAGRLHPKHGRWEVPGGTVEPGEHPRFAAFREFVEETGLVPIGLREVYVGQHTGPKGPHTARVFVATVEGQHGLGLTEDGRSVEGVPWATLVGPDGLYADTLRAAFPDGPPRWR